jgi:hypothetical protein
MLPAAEAAIAQSGNPNAAISGLTGTSEAKITPARERGSEGPPAGSMNLTPRTHVDTIGAIDFDPDPIPAAPARQQPKQSQAIQSPAGRDEPTIRVTIGRIDVRAIMPAPPARRSAPAQKQTALSLEEYLKRRSGGRL